MRKFWKVYKEWIARQKIMRAELEAEKQAIKQTEVDKQTKLKEEEQIDVEHEEEQSPQVKILLHLTLL
jgi:hypothetical protein